MKLVIGSRESGVGGRGGRVAPRLASAFPAGRRKGFTLLEVILAMLLGILLMGALYVALDMNLRQTQASRDAQEIEDVSRAVFNKISIDLGNILGPSTPNSGGTAPGGASSPSTATPTTPTTPTTPADTGGGMTGDMTTPPADDGSTPPPTTTPPTTTDEAETLATLLQFQTGVIGDSTTLSIFASRVPNALARPGALNLGTAAGQQRSGLVRIDFWMSERGLCRKERPWVTADAVGGASSTIDTSTEERDVLSEEVKEVLFEYLDSSGVDAGSWGQDSASPPGPPRAIRVTLTFEFTNPRGGDVITWTVSQTVVVRTSPGTMTPELIDPVAPSTGPTADTGTGTDMSTTPMTDGTSGGGTTGGGASGAKTGGTGGNTAGAKTGGTGGAKAGGTGGGTSGTKGGGGTGGTRTGGGTGGGGTKGGGTGGGGGAKGGRTP